MRFRIFNKCIDQIMFVMATMFEPQIICNSATAKKKKISSNRISSFTHGKTDESNTYYIYSPEFHLYKYIQRYVNLIKTFPIWLRIRLNVCVVPAKMTQTTEVNQFDHVIKKNAIYFTYYYYYPQARVDSHTHTHCCRIAHCLLLLNFLFLYFLFYRSCSFRRVVTVHFVFSSFFWWFVSVFPFYVCSVNRLDILSISYGPVWTIPCHAEFYVFFFHRSSPIFRAFIVHAPKLVRLHYIFRFPQHSSFLFPPVFIILSCAQEWEIPSGRGWKIKKLK